MIDSVLRKSTGKVEFVKSRKVFSKLNSSWFSLFKLYQSLKRAPTFEVSSIETLSFSWRIELNFASVVLSVDEVLLDTSSIDFCFLKSFEK